MKKLLIFGFLLVVSLALKAQQRPQYSQYMINPYVLNPAVGGAQDYIDIRAGYRNQWVNFEAHPVTMYLSVNGPIGKAMCTNTRTRHTKPGFHGVGGYLMADKTGPSQRYAGYLSYAYHLALGKNLFASLGVMGGVQQYRLDPSLLDIFTQNGSSDWVGSDNATGSLTSVSVPDFSAGTWIYGRDFYVGASISQVVRANLQYNFYNAKVGDVGRLVHHYFIMGGYRFRVDRDLMIVPSAAIKGVMHAPMSFDINCKVRYLDAYWAGVSYRRGDAIAALAGIVINNMFEVSYSYDITLSDIRKYNDGVHEIVIGYRIPLKPNLICPSHFW